MSNRIETEISASDRLRSRGKSASSLAADILADLKNAAPYSTTFVHSIPPELREQVEQEMRERFECWANSWIAPNLRAIIAKGA